MYHFVRLECISRKELTQNLNDLQGKNCIVEIDNFDIDFFHMSIYGEIPEKEWFGEPLEEDWDADWLEDTQYQRMKEHFETKQKRYEKENC